MCLESLVCSLKIFFKSLIWLCFILLTKQVTHAIFLLFSIHCQFPELLIKNYKQFSFLGNLNVIYVGDCKHLLFLKFIEGIGFWGKYILELILNNFLLRSLLRLSNDSFFHFSSTLSKALKHFQDVRMDLVKLVKTS